MWQRIINLFEQVGRARAAAELARQGHHELAQKLMLDKRKI